MSLLFCLCVFCDSFLCFFYPILLVSGIVCYKCDCSCIRRHAPPGKESDGHFLLVQDSPAVTLRGQLARVRAKKNGWLATPTLY